MTQHASTAEIMVAGDGDLDAAAEQVCRFLSLDVDARGWPHVADRDPVIAAAQAQLPAASRGPRPPPRRGRRLSDTPDAAHS